MILTLNVKKTMNITDSLVQLPTWEDYCYAPEEDVSNDFGTQVMANSHIAKAAHVSTPGNQLSSDERAEKIFQTATKSRAIRWLFLTATCSSSDHRQSGPWPIKFRSDLPFAAACSHIEREIYIRPNISDDEALSQFVFELTNAISSHKFAAICRKADQGIIGCEEYAKEYERIEFEGAITHHKVITEAIKEMNWSNTLDMWGAVISQDFETFWSKQKFTRHANSYRHDWSLRTGKKAVYPQADNILRFDPKSMKRAEKIFQTAMDSKAITALCIKALHSPSDTRPSGYWPIIFRNDLQFNAMCSHAEREIYIRPNISDDEALSEFVFELTNAISGHKFTALRRKADQDQIGCEEFVKEYMRIEFEGCITHHEVITEAIKETNWSDTLDVYKSVVSQDFETYWSKLKCTPYANSYRHEWSLRTGKKAVYAKI